MRDDFVIIIPTNNRVNTQFTYHTLKDNGYTGKIVFLVDDLDSSRFELMEKYPDEEIVVFNKKELAKQTDTMCNFEWLNSSVYAYNAGINWAKEQGYKYFALADDDIKSIFIKLNEGSKLKRYEINNLDSLFEIMLEFMDSADMVFFGPTLSGSYFGGITGAFKYEIQWNLSQLIICSAKNVIPFRGYHVCDQVTMLDVGNTGRPSFRTMRIAVDSPKSGKLEGGLKESYQVDSNAYCQTFISLIAHPSCMKISFNEKDKIFKNRILSNNVFPKVISGRYKK